MKQVRLNREQQAVRRAERSPARHYELTAIRRIPIPRAADLKYGSARWAGAKAP